MGLFNLFKKQLSTVIEWDSQDKDILWYQYPSATNEIKNASKLLLAPGQGCVLVYEGKIEDVLLEGGVFSLKTDNHPFITTLLKIRQNFESEHKLKVFFFRQAQVVNQSWGTASPIKYVDAVYQMPIEMGVNGTFSYKITDINLLFQEFIGSEKLFTTEQMKQIIAGRIPEAISSYLSAHSFPYQEIDSKLEVISSAIRHKLNHEFEKFGLELTDFKVLGTIVDEQTKRRIDKVSNLSSDVKAAEIAGISYVELEKLKALRDAAKNEGGISGTGLQMGVGLDLGRKFINETDRLLNEGEQEDVVNKLKKLNLLLQEGIITQADFDQKKKELLEKL